MKRLQGTIMIKVILIEEPRQLEAAHDIRKIVFVDEQKVPAEAEIDEYEDICHHYLALDDNDNPIGTARWRITSYGIKLERFAVLKDARGKGAGSALLEKILHEIASANLPQNLLYLHAQVNAMFLYEKFGFSAMGEMFEECGIKHYKMVKNI